MRSWKLLVLFTPGQRFFEITLSCTGNQVKLANGKHRKSALDRACIVQPDNEVVGLLFCGTHSPQGDEEIFFFLIDGQIAPPLLQFIKAGAPSVNKIYRKGRVAATVSVSPRASIAAWNSGLHEQPKLNSLLLCVYASCSHYFTQR